MYVSMYVCIMIVCNIVQHCILIECMPGMHETLSLIPISIPLKNLAMMDSFKEGWDSRRNNYLGLYITYLYYAWPKNTFQNPHSLTVPS